jgi:hypothetical protein
MYLAVLALHSVLRWVVLVALILTATAAVRGWTGARPWTPANARLGRIGVIAMDVQLLLGLLLYVFLSPMTHSAFANFGAAMRDPISRFWAVEHIFLMVGALVAVHVGFAMAKRAVEPVAKHRRTAIGFSLALVATLIAIPWPGTRTARPLLRGLSETPAAIESPLNPGQGDGSVATPETGSAPAAK